MMLPGLCSRLRMIHDTLDTRWASFWFWWWFRGGHFSGRSDVSAESVSGARSKKCVRLYEYRGGVTHSSTLSSVCTVIRNEKNQKEKSVSSAICLRHSYCSWPGLRKKPSAKAAAAASASAATTHPQPGRRSKMLFLRRHRWKFHEFSHPKSDNFLLFFHFLRPVSRSCDGAPGGFTQPKEKELFHTSRQKKGGNDVKPSTIFFFLLFSTDTALMANATK